MDCPSEEQMIRMELASFKEIHHLDFDIANRLLHCIHDGSSEPILLRLNKLKLNTSVITTEQDFKSSSPLYKDESQTLWAVLIINFSFFAIELIAGLVSRSMGLVADSLDMLADSIVYALALMAVGGSVKKKRNVARFAGYFQIILASVGFMEVVRRFINKEIMPDFQTMIFVSLAALVANIICFYLLQRRKSQDAHMQASMIFTSNDIIINTGVIVAGTLVYFLNSALPDLIIGAMVFLVVARGAYRILLLSK
jgi:Co/Zn/Cd efflux system component